MVYKKEVSTNTLSRREKQHKMWNRFRNCIQTQIFIETYKYKVLSVWGHKTLTLKHPCDKN